MTYGIVMVAAYLLGSIPFGLLIVQSMGMGDVRNIGSGNIGTTNVLRTGSKTAAAATLILDALKGAVAVLLARALLGETAAAAAGLIAFVGHLLPVWLRFRGGKGVATYLGVMLAIAWPAGLMACATWAAVAAVAKRSSVASLTASGLAPLILWAFGRADVLWLGAVLAALVWVKHWPNIMRLRAGTEPRIGRER
jgi:glycerol-3-phosphate acyltransferase PlsY